jgi:hypothetical protein
MKKKAVLFAIFGILLVGIASWTLVADSAIQRGEVRLGRGYVVGGVQLKEGQYLVIHDEAGMKTGDACTFFYRMPYHPGQQAAAKMHCTPVEGARVEGLTLRSTGQRDGTSLVKSLQFAGSTEVHTFPTGS